MVTCQSNGKWSEPTLFCDMPTKLKILIPSSEEDSKVLTVIDRKRHTCFGPGNDTEEIFQFSLDGELVPYAVLICFTEGIGKFTIRYSPTWNFTYDTYIDKWCEHPPENSVPNGQLEVSHSKAVLHCKEGFREKDGRDVYATCENNTWSFLSLECVESKPQKDNKLL
ncbi:hypothetical protein AVEN_219059-1, partial [Araneus ventricosus]